jgi:hypothetical protein
VIEQERIAHEIIASATEKGHDLITSYFANGGSGEEMVARIKRAGVVGDLHLERLRKHLDPVRFAREMTDDWLAALRGLQ